MPPRRALIEHRPPTDQERTFCEQYLIDLDPVAAAIRAGYERSVAEGAREWMKEPQIAGHINQLLTARGVRTHVTMDRVVMEYARIALNDPLDCFEQTVDDEGNASLAVKPMDKIPEDARRAIESIEVTANGGVRIKFSSKLDALKALEPHIQQMTPNTGRSRTALERQRDLFAMLQDVAQRNAARLPPANTKTKATVVTYEIEEIHDGAPEETNVTPIKKVEPK